MNEYAHVMRWIDTGARVLDLGCGDGALLARLRDERQVRGYGLEIDQDNVARCVERGVNVLRLDLDRDLANFDSDTFDAVILLQTLQAVRYPLALLREMLRIGREGVVTFPNFGHWRNRLQLGLDGRMPVTSALPAQWYDTKNIHLFTLADFEALCAQEGIEVVERALLDADRREIAVGRAWPSLLCEVALYRIRRASPEVD